MDSLSLVLISLLGVPPSSSATSPGAIAGKEPRMADIVFVALTAAFFIASVGLVYLFERLRENK